MHHFVSTLRIRTTDTRLQNSHTPITPLLTSQPQPGVLLIDTTLGRPPDDDKNCNCSQTQTHRAAALAEWKLLLMICKVQGQRSLAQAERETTATQPNFPVLADPPLFIYNCFSVFLPSCDERDDEREHLERNARYTSLHVSTVKGVGEEGEVGKRREGEGGGSGGKRLHPSFLLHNEQMKAMQTDQRLL
ncbi:hypothetical protein BaRGS_00029494 [Batillaria attramentaria]|uniref:Uncharacterized protein n=1 Tax=Batillaria attramentaria TaxID=370345 RepID=A0ABD0JX10_9CAEN